MKGKAITDGPLPFLFGARAETIKARYWIRGLPEGGKGQYWLEAVPKSRSDAQNFKQVVIVLDESTFLPVLLRVYAPNFNPKTNPAYTSYKFSNHDVTDDKLTANAILGKLNLFKTSFANPTTPAGWKRVVERSNGGAPNMPGALEAARPQTPPRNTQLPR
jgi:TIGR03009 family protein